MYIIKNKILQDSSGSIFKTVLNEIFLTADTFPGQFEYSTYLDAVRSNVVKQVMRLYLLNNDETPLQDVSSYVLSGSVQYNYQQGQTHSLNLEVVNADGFWIADPINGNVWRGSKFSLDVGIYARGTVYWRRCGIFVLKDISFHGTPTQTISLQLYDKFALLDKKIGGNIESDFKIPVNTNLMTAINMCLQCDCGNGKPYDTKPIFYESDLSGIKTPYTITKTPNTSIGNVITELADMASHDVYYNETGNLTLRPGIKSMSYDNRGVQWYYTDKRHLSYAEPSYSIDYGAVINKIVVKGAIVNGYQFKGTAINDNPLSKSNVNINSTNTEYIEDKNITSDSLAQERAEYELNKRLIAYTKSSFKSIFIPHLSPRDIVMWTCPEFNIYNEKFVIQALSFSLGSGFFMNLDMANVKEVGTVG